MISRGRGHTEPAVSPRRGAVGIDLGLKDTAVRAEGEPLEAARPLRERLFTALVPLE